MLLRAPSSFDKPAKISRNGALTGKKPEKSKPFKKKQDVDGDVAATVTAVANTPLAVWLRAGNGHREGFMEATQYLLRGPPFKGISKYDAKETMKETGATWVPNPLHIKKAKDMVVGGWWSAPDERTLEKLLSLQPYHDGTLQWTALDVPRDLNDNIVRLIREHAMEDKQQRSREEAAAQNARREKEAAANARSDDDGFVPDDARDLELFEQKYGFRPTDEMLAKTSRAGILGPHAGISRIRRLERGLRHKLLTIAQVHSCDFEEVASKRKRIDDDSTERLDASKKPEDAMPLKRTGPSSGCFFFGASKGTLTNLTDKEWLNLHNAMRELGAKRIKPRLDNYVPRSRSQTRCESCVDIVDEQFNECSCYLHGGVNRTWTWCETCLAATTNDGWRQNCKCADEHSDAWCVRQRQLCEEANSRVQKAEAEVVAMIATNRLNGGGEIAEEYGGVASSALHESEKETLHAGEKEATTMHEWLGVSM